MGVLSGLQIAGLPCQHTSPNAAILRETRRVSRQQRPTQLAGCGRGSSSCITVSNSGSSSSWLQCEGGAGTAVLSKVNYGAQIFSRKINAANPTPTPRFACCMPYFIATSCPCACRGIVLHTTHPVAAMRVKGHRVQVFPFLEKSNSPLSTLLPPTLVTTNNKHAARRRPPRAPHSRWRSERSSECNRCVALRWRRWWRRGGRWYWVWVAGGEREARGGAGV